MIVKLKHISLVTSLAPISVTQECIKKCLEEAGVSKCYDNAWLLGMEQSATLYKVETKPKDHPMLGVVWEEVQ